MVYSFQSRLDHLGERMNQVNGEEITLARGANTTPGVTASPVLMKGEEIIPGIAVTRVDFQLWAIDVDDYRISSVSVLPAVGDTITRADGSIYRVSSMGPDSPPFQYTTSTRNRYLLHTERVG